MQGFFPDRGVLGRQGRDTDASNDEVLAERQVLGPACGLVFGAIESAVKREGRCCVRGEVVFRWRPLRECWRSASRAFYSLRRYLMLF